MRSGRSVGPDPNGQQNIHSVPVEGIGDYQAKSAACPQQATASGQPYDNRFLTSERLTQRKLWADPYGWRQFP